MEGEILKEVVTQVDFSWKEGITLGAALVGATLGILNTWHTLNQTKIKLRVRPAYAIRENSTAFLIEVVNLSTFPLIIAEAGFTRRGFRGQRFPIAEAQLSNGQCIPIHLTPRESVSILFNPMVFYGLGNEISQAYVRTACGHYQYGKSPALRQLKGMLSGDDDA